MAYSYGALSAAVTSKPLAITYDSTISSTTAITLNVLTSGIEVTAITNAIFLKWNATASTSAFDGVIPAGTSKVFMVPGGTVTANFIEEAASAHLVCIEF